MRPFMINKFFRGISALIIGGHTVLLTIARLITFELLRIATEFKMTSTVFGRIVQVQMCMLQDQVVATFF